MDKLFSLAIGITVTIILTFGIGEIINQDNKSKSDCNTSEMTVVHYVNKEDLSSQEFMQELNALNANKRSVTILPSDCDDKAKIYIGSEQKKTAKNITNKDECFVKYVCIFLLILLIAVVISMIAYYVIEDNF